MFSFKSRRVDLHDFILPRAYRTDKDLNGHEIEESLEISVSDTGCGINRKEMDKLFHKWEQLGSSIQGSALV